MNADVVALLASLHAGNTITPLGKRFRDPTHASVRYGVERVDLGDAARAYARRLARDHDVVRLYHGTTAARARRIVREGFADAEVYAKDVLRANYALEHGTDGAVLELDYYDDGTHARRNQFTWIVRATRVVPRRVLRLDEVDVAEEDRVALGPPPLMRARRVR